MTPFKCQTKHNPPDTYGDCLRASVASMLDIDPPIDVPHFFHDGCDGETAMHRLSGYLAKHGLAPWWSHLEGSATLNDVLASLEHTNPGVYYLLFGSTPDGPHVVIGCGGKVIHDTAWIPQRMSKPGPNGLWSICVFVSNRMVKS